METITKTYEVYTFDELSEEAKDKAISDHIDFWMEIFCNDENAPESYKQAVETCERLQTPWFLGQVVYENAKNEIVEEIKINEYQFLKSGEIFPAQ